MEVEKQVVVNFKISYVGILDCVENFDRKRNICYVLGVKGKMKGGDGKGVVTAGPPAINLRRINFSLRKINQNFAPERDIS